MSIVVEDIRRVLFDFAPAYMKMGDWDNVGLLVGDPKKEVRRVLVALDVMEDSIREAAQWGADLMVSHHPVIFEPLRSVTTETVSGRRVMELIRRDIAAINLHTNLDCCPGGVNDVLAATLGLQEIRLLDPVGEDEQGRAYGLLRMGTVAEQPLSAFAAFVSGRLHAHGVRYAGARCVHRVAVGGGSCGSELQAVISAGCDTFVTADLKYNQLQEAEEYGINLIDAGHFETENPVCTLLCDLLRRNFPSVEVRLSEFHESKTQFHVNP